MTPIRWAEEQCDPLAGDFIDDYALGIVAAALTLDGRGSGNAEEESEEDSDEKGDEKNARTGVGEPSECGPEKDGGDGAPGAGTGLDEADAEKGGDGMRPDGFLNGLHRRDARFGRRLLTVHPSLHRDQTRGRRDLRELRGRGRAS